MRMLNFNGSIKSRPNLGDLNENHQKISIGKPKLSKLK